MVVHDYPVKRRTADELERVAKFHRSQWQMPSENRLNVFDLMFGDPPASLRALGLKMVPRNVGHMGDREAYAAPRSKRIFFRESLRARLRFGDPVAAFIFLHELAHLILHPGGEKAWLVAGNVTPNFICEEESSEWQANVLAMCWLAPAASAIACTSSAMLAERFGLDAGTAALRFEMLSRRKPRRLPNQEKKLVRPMPLEEHSAVYLNDWCARCGQRMLTEVSGKQRCDGCRHHWDGFQDGDRVDF